MGCDFVAAIGALAGRRWEAEVCEGISGGKLDLLRNRNPSVRASSRDWPMALFSFSAEPGADLVLRTPALVDASCRHLCARFPGGGSSLLSIIPCCLGHLLRRRAVGIPLAAHPGSHSLGNGHSFHHDNGLALFRGCPRW